MDAFTVGETTVYGAAVTLPVTAETTDCLRFNLRYVTPNTVATSRLAIYWEVLSEVAKAEIAAIYNYDWDGNYAILESQFLFYDEPATNYYADLNSPPQV